VPARPVLFQVLNRVECGIKNDIRGELQPDAFHATNICARG